MKPAFPLLLLCLVSLALYAADSQPPAPTGTETGRFQLAAGTVPDIKAGNETATMFRLDTTTGKAWQLQPVPLRHANGLTTVPTWVEIQETNGEMYQAAIQSLRGP
jgi:hypothetical protein